MHKNPSGIAKLANSDTFVAMLCTGIVAALYCLKFGLAQGNLLQSAALSMFVMPIALAITIFVELPILFLMRMKKRTSPLEYALVPGLIVLVLCIALTLSGAGTFSVLHADGHDLFRDGEVVWGNIGWLIVDLEYVEPALWASLAGLGFWLIRVRPQKQPAMSDT